mmetsp:Transcript_16109/g.40113  ORF Transcript_16109/g.40113 Transcript_16109/m.40113 type:complete len:208 (+) Transcript_16109:238-861(+)
MPCQLMHSTSIMSQRTQPTQLPSSQVYVPLSHTTSNCLSQALIPASQNPPMPPTLPWSHIGQGHASTSLRCQSLLITSHLVEIVLPTLCSHRPCNLPMHSHSHGSRYLPSSTESRLIISLHTLPRPLHPRHSVNALLMPAPKNAMRACPRAPCTCLSNVRLVQAGSRVGSCFQRLRSTQQRSSVSERSCWPHSSPRPLSSWLPATRG